MSLRVIVVGAGIGGLTLAQGLYRAGIDVMVYEKDGAATRRAHPRSAADRPFWTRAET